MSLPTTKKNATEMLTQGSLLNGITNRIRQSLELEEILSATVAEMRLFLDTDRVKVYRFHEDGTGEVIAESIYQHRLPSLLGLHFPASDIPPHAREMFIKARVRSIVDIPAQRITLHAINSLDTTGGLTTEEIQDREIWDILERPVDPCHVEYLTRMGVQSSLVVPIFHNRQLWGLLVSHHVEPKTFSPADLQIVQMVADQVSVAISQSHLLSQARAKAHRETLINQISRLLHAPLNIQEILQGVLQKVVKAVGCAGGRLYLNPMDAISLPDLYTIGPQPNLSAETGKSQWLEYHAFWQHLMAHEHTSAGGFKPAQTDDSGNWADFSDTDEAEEAGDFELDNNTLLEGRRSIPSLMRIVKDIYQEPALKPVAEAFRETSIRSLIVMPLRYGQQSLGCLTLFRNEINTDILWAGRFNPDERIAKVRDSFETWRELKIGLAPTWTRDELELVQSLGAHLAMAVMQNRLYLWEREHRLLVEMRNQELNTARAAAEEASRLKSDFLSSTSHELRTPLASTLNYLKLLKEGFYDNPEELTEYIHVAHQSAENLVAIINDVLDIAKIEAGRMNVNFERVALLPLLNELKRMFNIDSRHKGIALIFECEVETVWADKVKLRQILTNLLSNAFKFTSAGEVRIQVSQRFGLNVSSSPKLPHRIPKQFVQISVADTGIGINATQANLLFEPFVQGDGSIKRRYGGTGLGLTVCKRLVELMGGQIWLESAGQGQGTTVAFTLPWTYEAKDTQSI